MNAACHCVIEYEVILVSFATYELHDLEECKGFES